MIRKRIKITINKRINIHQSKKTFKSWTTKERSLDLNQRKNSMNIRNGKKINKNRK